ncbi:hypothetical protein Q5O24_12475 [Eubacteriaceae bacterium ES3]|nr:hypothetical protein Q5O24_12475 [Eubacteriaceae bacterium ES3]
MNNYDEICKRIGNEYLENLLDSIIGRDNYKDMPEYMEVLGQLNSLLNQIPDNDLKYEIDTTFDNCTSAALFQGFVLGFNEAVGLLTGGVK